MTEVDHVFRLHSVDVLVHSEDSALVNVHVVGHVALVELTFAVTDISVLLATRVIAVSCVSGSVEVHIIRTFFRDEFLVCQVLELVELTLTPDAVVREIVVLVLDDAPRVVQGEAGVLTGGSSSRFGGCRSSRSPRSLVFDSRSFLRSCGSVTTGSCGVV